MDNCVKENKNKYVFGFLSILVEKNIFTEVSIVYIKLCVNVCMAHTHINKYTTQFAGTFVRR